MDTPLTRRRFLERSATLGAGLAAAPVLSRLTAAEAPSNRVRVAVMGLSRGMSHVAGLFGAGWGGYCLRLRR